MISPQKLGAEVAKAQDRVIEQRHKDKAELEEMRAFLFGESGSRRIEKRIRNRRTASFAIFGLAAAAGIALVLGIGVFGRERHEKEPATLAGRWISAPPDSEEALDFPDGSTVVLTPGAHARVISSGSKGSHVSVEYGAARFDVRHRPDTEWRVDVGPYNINITGTSFHTSWVPDKKIFTLKLVQGDVVLRGPLVRNWQRVSSGETFTAWLKENRVEFLRTAAETNDLENTAQPHFQDAGPVSDHEGQVSGDPHPSSGRTARDQSDLPRPPSWRTLNREGKFAEVFDAATARGWERALKTASATDLLALGDACRLLGKYDKADETYRWVRDRFPRSGAASTAAFALGKMAFDQAKKYQQAIKWLDVYLDEQPRGDLAKEALGRLMEARNRAGDFEGARTAAKEYLVRFPDGPHARIARQITGDM